MTRKRRKSTSKQAVEIAASPPILIEVDPSVSGGFLHGRFDATIRGRVVSVSPAEEIVVHVNGEAVTLAQYGDPEHAAVAMLPDGSHGRQRAFHFNLPWLQDLAGGLCNATIVARTADGDTHRESFVLAVAPYDPQPVALLSGPTQNTIADAGIRPPVIIYVERAALDGDGNLIVHGWAIALTTLVTVQIFASEARISAARLGGVRGDVASIYPAYPNAPVSGFSLSMLLSEEFHGATSVRVQAIGQFGFAHEVTMPLERLPGRTLRPAATPAPSPLNLLGQEPADRLTTNFRIENEPTASGLLAGGSVSVELPPPHPVHMYCDIVTLTRDGYLALEGWATCADDVAVITVYLDDVLVGEAEFGRERLDVARQFPNIPSAIHAGFQFDRRVIDIAGRDHSVRLLVRSGAGAEKSENFHITSVLPAAPATPLLGDGTGTTELEEFRFQLDSPRIVDGVAVALVTGRLTIEGWILARSGVAGIDVFLDGHRLGEVHYGLARQDVGSAFPEWDSASRSGFAFHCPPRSLRDGQHDFRIDIRSKNSDVLSEIFSVVVKKSEDHDDIGTIRHRVPRAESDMMESLLAELTGTGAPTRFMLFLRHHGVVVPSPLAMTFNALRLQSFRDWQLTVLADDDRCRDDIESVRAEFGDAFESQVTVATPSGSAWSLPLRTGDSFIGFLCVGDELGADALMEFALAGQLRPDADFIYADETRISPASQEREPFFKPDFSPDLLLSTNYIGHPWIARASLLDAMAVTPATLAGLGEYDLVLRLTEAATRIHHIPKLLCARGSQDLDPAGLCSAALARAAERRNIVAEILPTAVAGTWRFKRGLAATPKVSIIIPTCAAHGYIETCIETLRAKTTYPDYEIIVIDNIPDSQMAWKIWLQQHADKVVDLPLLFNWSRFNNTAADYADGDYLLFLNDDIEIIQDDWLETMMEHAQRPDVGVTGARLLYPDRKIQHAGMFLADNGIGRHAFRLAAEDEPGYFGLAQTQRNTIAVTGACMLVRSEVFDRLGRFDEAHEIVNNDLDFCLRTHRAGLLTVYTPHATLIHHELASRERMKDVYDHSHFNSHWKTRFAAGDPYFNPNLSRQADDYRQADEPTMLVYPGNPLFRADDIQRILVVKLDHIGDFVTALPAIRRLRHLFPRAKISVLAGPTSKAFASLEPAIDEFIEFAFFHTRSQLGERDLTKDDFAELAKQLKPKRFDLAVDLRKHLSTRDVLLHTGARFLAGFDYLGRCPYLDIVVEWDGDKALQRKRAHVMDDLLALIAAIGRAAISDRAVMSPGIEPTPTGELPAHVRRLFDKPVVAIHPGAGNTTKQWPEEHFSALIDLLIERNDVNILLVGGPDEVEIADALMETVLCSDSVASMAGQTSLAMLPRLLAACVLYIGNDSGPKHIAAAMGLPTIGIHSGVVDAAEWGPVGERAVAVQRNMTCSPCYLAVAADCPRELACLHGLEVTHVHNLAETLLMRPIAAPKPVVWADTMVDADVVASR